MNTATILIISLVAGKIASIIYRAIKDSKEETDEEEIEDEQTTTDTTK